MAAPSLSASAGPKSYGTVTTGTDTITSGGSNRVTYAWFFTDAGGSATQVTACDIGGNAMTRVGGATSGGARNIELWRLINPPNSSQTFTWTATGATGNWFTILVAYQDADQTTPDHNFASTVIGASGTDGGTTVTSATGETVIDFVAAASPGTDGGNVTSGYSALGGVRRVGSGLTAPLASDCPGASSITTAWLRVTDQFWIAGGISLKPVAAAASFFATALCIAAAGFAYQPLDTSAGMPRTLQATVAYAPAIPPQHIAPVQMRWQPLDTSQGMAKVLRPELVLPIGVKPVWLPSPSQQWIPADTSRGQANVLRTVPPSPFNGLSFVSTPWTWYQPLDTSRGIYKGLYGDAVPPFRGSTGVPTPSVSTIADTTQDMPATLRQVIPLPVASPESPPTPSTAFAPDDTSQSIPIALRTAPPAAPPGFSAGYVATPFGLWQPLNTSYSTNPNLLPPDATVPPVIVVSPGAGHAKKVLRDRQERELFELLVHQKREQLKALAAQQKAAEVAVATARKPKAQAKAEEKLGEVIARNDAALAEYEELVQQMAYQRWIDEDDDDIMQIMNLL